MAGTTVADDGLVVDAFEAAATAGGLPESGAERGQSPPVRARHHGPVQDRRLPRSVRERGARPAGERGLRDAPTSELIDDGNAQPIPGAAEAITDLRSAGVKVALTTGFSRTTQDKLLAALGWQSLRRPALWLPATACAAAPTPT